MQNKAVRQFGRYVINGLMATAVQYTVLRLNLDTLGMTSAGVANFVASIFGISASFLGSRYYVFRASERPIPKQALLFVISYSIIAVVTGLVMYFLVDLRGYNRDVSFVLATCVQVALSFWTNKKLVFR